MLFALLLAVVLLVGGAHCQLDDPCALASCLPSAPCYCKVNEVSTVIKAGYDTLEDDGVLAFRIRPDSAVKMTVTVDSSTGWSSAGAVRFDVHLIDDQHLLGVKHRSGYLRPPVLLASNVNTFQWPDPAANYGDCLSEHLYPDLLTNGSWYLLIEHSSVFNEGPGTVDPPAGATVTLEWSVSAYDCSSSTAERWGSVDPKCKPSALAKIINMNEGALCGEISTQFDGTAYMKQLPAGKWQMKMSSQCLGDGNCDFIAHNIPPAVRDRFCSGFGSFDYSGVEQPPCSRNSQRDGRFECSGAVVVTLTEPAWFLLKGENGTMRLEFEIRPEGVACPANGGMSVGGPSGPLKAVGRDKYGNLVDANGTPIDANGVPLEIGPDGVPIPRDTGGAPGGDSGGGGSTAGIVIGVLFALLVVALLVAAGVYYMRKKDSGGGGGVGMSPAKEAGNNSRRSRHSLHGSRRSRSRVMDMSGSRRSFAKGRDQW